MKKLFTWSPVLKNVYFFLPNHVSQTLYISPKKNYSKTSMLINNLDVEFNHDVWNTYDIASSGMWIPD